MCIYCNGTSGAMGNHVKAYAIAARGARGGRPQTSAGDGGGGINSANAAGETPARKRPPETGAAGAKAPGFAIAQISGDIHPSDDLRAGTGAPPEHHRGTGRPRQTSPQSPPTPGRPPAAAGTARRRPAEDGAARALRHPIPGGTCRPSCRHPPASHPLPANRQIFASRR